MSTLICKEELNLLVGSHWLAHNLVVQEVIQLGAGTVVSAEVQLHRLQGKYTWEWELRGDKVGENTHFIS